MRYQIHRGGQARTVKGVVAKRRIQREQHGLVLVAQGNRSVREVAETVAKANYWWTDLRRGQNTIYGSLLRFIDASIALGVPLHVMLAIPGMLNVYIREQYEPADTGEFPMAA